jgi:hypothetical protein
MKPGDSKNRPGLCYTLSSKNNQESWFRRRSEKLNLNVSDKSLVDKCISVFLVND